MQRLYQKIPPLYRTVLFYGALLAILVLIMSLLRFKHIVYDITTEVYVTLVGSVLLVVGIWFGKKLTPGNSGSPIESNSDPTFIAGSAELLGISKREIEVLRLIAEGNSNQEIGDQLFISLSTVKSHSSNLYSKLGVTNRVQAIKTAREQGLIE